MSAVARADYMDSQKVQMIAETIQREKKIVREFYTKQQAAGNIHPWQPPPPPVVRTLQETVGLPEHVSTIKLDPDQALALSVSKNTWSTSNPGYITRDGTRLTSVAKSDYVWDEEEIAYMKAHGEFGKTYNKRRDEFVDYVEHSARSFQLLKKMGVAPNK